MRRGLTLIEVLATVSLLALTGSIALVSLSGLGDLAILEQASFEITAADRHARAFALREGPMHLRYEAGLVQLVPMENDEASLRDAQLPHRLSIVVRVDGQPTEAVRFEARGESPDYSADLQTGNVSRRMQCAGLTGWWEEAE